MGGNRAYARAEVDDRLLDCKAMYIEEVLAKSNPDALRTPEGVYDALPEVFPWTGEDSLWRPATPAELRNGSGDSTQACLGPPGHGITLRGSLS